MEITQGEKATAISSAERVRVFKELGTSRYYQEVHMYIIEIYEY